MPRPPLQVYGQPFTAFEYRYTTGGGKSSHTHRVVVLLWEPPEPPLPEFCLTPEGFWDRVGQRLGV